MRRGLSSAAWLFRRHLSTAHVLATHVTSCKVTVHAGTRCLTTVLSVVHELQGWQASMPWDTNPLYALMHESIYCHPAASNWAAHRIRQVQLFVIHASQLHCSKLESVYYSQAAQDRVRNEICGAQQRHVGRPALCKHPMSVILNEMHVHSVTHVGSLLFSTQPSHNATCSAAGCLMGDTA